MIRLDKACDLSAFCDTESSRYALGGMRFRPPSREDVLARYRELRSVDSAPRERTVTNKRTGETKTVRRYGKRPIHPQPIPAQQALREAKSALRGCIVATNGRLAVFVPTLNGDEFPTTPGSGREPRECIIPAAAVKNAVRQIPRAAVVKTKPVLGSVRLTQHDDSHVVLSTTDCERTVDTTERVLDGRFPDVDRVWPTGAPIASVRLDSHLLESIVRHVRQHAPDDNRGVEILFRGEDCAVEFRFALSDDREAKAVLMPLAKNK